jgi:hypothetical protein
MWYLACDVVGCGIDFSQNRAFYTKNGTFLGTLPFPACAPLHLPYIILSGNVFDKVGSSIPIYPSVGLRHSGEAVRVNFGHEQFRFDIDDYVLQARNATWAGIMSTPLRREFITNVPPPPPPTPAGANPGGKVEEGEASVPSAGSQSDAGMDIAAAMGVEGKGPINELVLSYLSHHGYAKTARAFQAQCERRGGLGSEVPLPVPPPTTALPVPPPDVTGDIDMEMYLYNSKTPPPSVPPTTTDQTSAPTFDGWGPDLHHGDIELRTRIVNSVIAGDIDTALAQTSKWHPKVLEREKGLMLFKLRCRKFVELLLEAAELKKRMRVEEGASAVDGKLEDGDVSEGDRMDVDVDMDDVGEETAVVNANGFGDSSGSPAIPIKAKRKQSVSGWTGAATAQYEMALNSAISYGQTLQSDYKTDSRPEVRAIFNRTFGVVAYEDPLGAGGDVAEVAGQEARLVLATELNQDILRESRLNLF